MLLTCDIGNSFIKLGFYDGDQQVHFEKFPLTELPYSFLSSSKYDMVAISSVVPEATEKLKEFFITQLNIDPFIISIDSKLPLKIDYATPSTLGIDRICSAVGALTLFKDKSNHYKENDIIVSIDLGTATTINIVKYESIFSGGIIAPGLKLMAESLNKNTAQLPEIDLSGYENIIGKSTNQAILSGAVNSTVGLLDRVVKELAQSGNTHVYITGGNASYILNLLDFKYDFVNDLVSRGIKAIDDFNLKGN